VARRILIIDDDPGIRKVLSDRLKKYGFDVATASDGAEGLAEIRAVRPDVVLLDLQMPVMDGMGVLRQLQEEESNITVIVATAHGTIQSAVEAVKVGAYDFLTKPLEFDVVEVTIERALERDALITKLGHLREEAADQFPGVIGSSPAMQKVLDTARRVAESATTVLLLGETGTGKEVLARAIHNWSPRADGTFVAVNCAALADQLLESELFGHEKGAFTGAHKLRRGRFEFASGGTLFLDEVGEMKLPLQAKLLRVLEGGGFERVGGNVTLHSDARIIAATNKDLAAAARDSRFREDLYYRLNVVAIEVPPLRERKEDIKELAIFFARRHCASTKQAEKELASDTLEALRDYPWPGNVRELDNAIERAVVLTTESTITPDDLPEHIVELATARDASRGDGQPGYHAAVAEYRRELIEDALRRTNGNQTKAAELLGLQRTYLARLIRNLKVPES
jgi:DNA-binding NtrC family response regulator